jgi:hypothetical protein
MGFGEYDSYTGTGTGCRIGVFVSGKNKATGMGKNKPSPLFFS